MAVHIAIPEPASPEAVHDAAAYNLRALPQYLHALISAGATPIPVPLHESRDRVRKILATIDGILLPGSPADIDAARYGQTRRSETADPDPARAAVDELLVEEAFRLRKPILAICQGTQFLNVWRGGTLVQDIPAQVGTEVNHAPERGVLEAHAVAVRAGTRLAGLTPGWGEATGLVAALASGPASGPPLGPSARHGEYAFRARHGRPQDAALPPEEDAAHLFVNSSHHQAIERPGRGLLVSAVSPEDGVIEAVELDSEKHFVVAVQWHPERTYDHSAFSRNIFHAFVDAAAR